MAAALRMTVRPWHLLSLGPFGAAVAERLAVTRPDAMRTRVDEQGGEETAHWPVASVMVLCAWRASLRAERLLDAASFSWRVPWLPVILEHPEIRVGPLVVPGQGPCHRCFRLRTEQQSSSADLTGALHERYEHDPALGPAGFMPFHVTIATGLALDELTRRRPGRWRRLNVVTLQPSGGRVIGVHGCARCGSGVDERSRSHAELDRELPALLGARSPA